MSTMTHFRHLVWDGRRCLVMAVVNVTPDSFSDGGAYATVDDAVRAGADFFAQGADIVDVGGESTRPGSQPVSEEMESTRVLPVIEKLAAYGTVSIDTTKAAVARRAIEAGAEIVNDVSGGTMEPKLFEVVAHTKVTVVIGHLRGQPERMAELAVYSDVSAEVTMELRAQIAQARATGIADDAIWIDPGLGFAKRSEHNARLLADLSGLTAMGYPVVIGASRKSFLGQWTGRPTRERDVATAAAHAIAVFQGARIIRAHDVRASVDVCRVAEALRQVSASMQSRT